MYRFWYSIPSSSDLSCALAQAAGSHGRHCSASRGSPSIPHFPRTMNPQRARHDWRRSKAHGLPGVGGAVDGALPVLSVSRILTAFLSSLRRSWYSRARAHAHVCTLTHDIYYVFTLFLLSKEVWEASQRNIRHNSFANWENSCDAHVTLVTHPLLRLFRFVSLELRIL